MNGQSYCHDARTLTHSSPASVAAAATTAMGCIQASLSRMRTPLDSHVSSTTGKPFQLQLPRSTECDEGLYHLQFGCLSPSLCNYQNNNIHHPYQHPAPIIIPTETPSPSPSPSRSNHHPSSSITHTDFTSIKPHHYTFHYPNIHIKFQSPSLPFIIIIRGIIHYQTLQFTTHLITQFQCVMN